MGIIGWIVFGFVVGLLARAIFPGRDAMGFVGTTLLGIVGAVLAGWLGTQFGWYTQDSSVGMLAAIVGALVVLGGYNAVISRRKGPPNISGRSDRDRDRFAA